MLISAYTVLQADYPIPNFDLFDDEEWSVMPEGTSSSCSRVQPGDDKEITSARFFTKPFAKHGKVWFARSIWSQCRATQKGRQFSNDMWRDEVLKRAENIQWILQLFLPEAQRYTMQGKKD